MCCERLRCDTTNNKPVMASHGSWLHTYMAVSILFFARKRSPGQLFRTFRESFSMFSPSRNLFRWRDIFFFNFRWHQRDSFGLKIVSIGAILAIFRPFEVSTTTTTKRKTKKTKCVSNDRSRREDQFCPKIVKIGAIPGG